jgi:peptide subunit release factor 1 (eRF1)
MESPNEMFEDIKEVASVLGVNLAAIALSISEIEQTVRIIGGLVAIIYTSVKIYKLLCK